MYAVKTNPEPVVLKALSRAGIKHFDVASLTEIALVARECPKAAMYYMHPVKSRESILYAYHKFGVRCFALDSMDELTKIKEMTHNATDLALYIRITIPNEHAAYSLKGKFGIAGEEAVELMREARGVARKLGVCFHVGSQCMDPAGYTVALEHVRALADQASVKIDAVDAIRAKRPDLAKILDEMEAEKLLLRGK